MPKLSDTQLVILASAAKREDGAILPPPKSLNINGGALTSVLKSLLKKKLVAEQAAPPDAPAWRESEDGQQFMIVITPAGLEAIGVEPEPGTRPDALLTASLWRTKTKLRKRRNGERRKPRAVKRATDKQDPFIHLLRRRKGATIADLQDATGWQPHSVRAALTGLRKKGHVIARSRSEGDVTRYRITDDAGAAQQ